MQICETKQYKILPNCEITPKTGVGIGLLNPRSCNKIFSIIGSRCNSPMGAGDNGSDARVSFSESCVCGFDPNLGQDFFHMFVPTSAYVVRMELSYLGLSERGQLQCRIASSSETVTLSFYICYTTAAQLCEWCAAVRQTKNFRHKIGSLCAKVCTPFLFSH